MARKTNSQLIIVNCIYTNVIVSHFSCVIFSIDYYAFYLKIISTANYYQYN